MSIARRVRAGIALHAGVNVVFAAVAVISAAGGSAVAVASEGPGSADRGAGRLVLRHLAVAQRRAPAARRRRRGGHRPTVTVASPHSRHHADRVGPPRLGSSPATDHHHRRRRPPAGIREVISTGYCLVGHHGQRAAGRPTGMAAMNGVPLGTEWRRPRRARAPAPIFEVTDRIGHGTQFDIWFADCDDALAYGRRTITDRAGRLSGPV